MKFFSVLLIILLSSNVIFGQTVSNNIAPVKAKHLYDLIGDGLTAAKKTDTINYGLSSESTMKVDGTWPDIDYTAPKDITWDGNVHVYRTKVMSQAYHLTAIPADKAKLLIAIKASLSHWLTADYRYVGNWYKEMLAVPLELGHISMIMNDELEPSQNTKIINIIYTRSKIDQRHQSEVGANAIMFCRNNIIGGILKNDESHITAAVTRAAQEVKIGSDVGIQADYSFHFHGPCLQITGYGTIFSNYTSKMAWQTSGTIFTFPEAKIQIIERYILDGQQWFFKNDMPDYLAEARGVIYGRNATSNDRQAFAGEYMKRMNRPRKQEFSEFSNRLLDKTIGTGELSGNKMFTESGMMIHRRQNFYLSVKMLAYDVANTDQVNNQNKLAHYSSDGAMSIMKTGQEYLEIFPTWDWLKLPGTTVEKDSPTMTWANVRTQGCRRFVGGVSDGQNGVAAMDLARGDQTGESLGWFSTRRINSSKITLVAKKSWFFMGDEVLCLGANIKGTTSKPITTGINQCHLAGSAEINLDNGKVRSVFHDGVGYYFHGDQNVQVSQGEQTGSWRIISDSGKDDLITNDVFKLWINHDDVSNSEGQSYQYSILPEISSSNLKTHTSQLSVISNTKSIQAVQHSNGTTASIVFHEPGNITIFGNHNVAVSESCILMLEKTSSTKFSVNFSKPDTSIQSSKLVSVTIDSNSVTFPVPDNKGLTFSKIIALSGTTQHTISATFGAKGAVSPSGSVLVDEGSDKTFTITAQNGYLVDDVLVDNNSIGATNSHTFTNVMADASIHATFKIKTYLITASSGSNGSISSEGAVAVNHGENKSYTISPNAGYEIDSLKVDDVSQTVASTYDFTNITSTHTINVTFKLIPIQTFTIDSSDEAGGSISPKGTIVINIGDDALFTNTANAGYLLDDVIVNSVSVGAVPTYTFSNVTANNTIQAKFKIKTYVITATSGSNGSISSEGATVVNYDSGKAYTIAPDAGYEVDILKVDDVVKTAATTYNFTNVTSDHTIEVTFKLVSAGLSDIELIKSRLFDDFVPDGTQSLAAIALKTEATLYLNTMTAQGTWDDIDYTTLNSSKILAGFHTNRLTTLSSAYVSDHPEFRNNQALLDKILLSLKWWLDLDLTTNLWYHDLIHIPYRQALVLLLLKDNVPAADKVRIIDRIQARSNFNVNPNYLTPSNMTTFARNVILSGCLSNTEADIHLAFLKAGGTIVIEDNTEGIQTDLSYHSHGDCHQIGSYGVNFSLQLAKMVWLGSGTKFSFPQENYDILMDFILESQQFFVRGPSFDYLTKGRTNTRRPSINGLTDKPSWRFIAETPHPKQQESQDFYARLEMRNPAGQGAPVGNKFYWRSDMQVHRRVGYYASVKLLSRDVATTDSISTPSSGIFNHYFSDGAMCLMRTGLEYHEIAPVMDWLKIPGTTVEKDNPDMIYSKVRTKGVRKFVGGISDGTYGVSTMDLARGDVTGEKLEWQQTRRIDINKITLTAKKAWFFFDNEIVCLGAAINCTTQNPVFTTLNQCLKVGNVELSDPTQFNSAGLSTAPVWATHDGFSYYIPQNSKIKLETNSVDGNWNIVNLNEADSPVTEDIFKLWLDHGTNPQNESYVYYILPQKPFNEMASFNSNNPIEIINNNKDIQSVYHSTLKIYSVVFHKAGTLTHNGQDIVSVNKSCILMIKVNDDNSFKITMTKPEDNSGITVASIEGVTSDFDFTGKAGQSITQTIYLGNHSISSSSGSNGSITPGRYDNIKTGSERIFTITPAIGYEVDSLKVDDVTQAVASSYTFTNISTDHTINVTFKLTAIVTYNVSYNGNTNTGGSLPIDSNNYLIGATVTVLGNSGALNKTGFSFNNWNTKANGSGTSYAPSNSFTMGASNVTLYAQWTALPTYNVTYNGNTNNSGSVPADNNSYLNGTSVTVLGNTGNLAKNGFSFISWNTIANGSGTSYAGGSTFSMGSSNITLYAQWTALPTYSVTYNGNTNSGGSIPADSNNYLNGATVTVLGNSGALIKTGFSFNNWNTKANGSGASYASSNSFTMGSSNVILYAQWLVIPTHTITASNGSNGSINPAGTIAVVNGANAVFTMNPVAGYEVDTVTVDGISAGNVSSYSFSSVTSDQTISVTFKIKTYNIISSAGAKGSINPNGSTAINHGANQTYTITPNNGYQVNDVLVDGASQGVITRYTFNSVDDNHTIAASFSLIPIVHTIISSAGSNGTISPSGTSIVGDGDDLSFSITPNAGYEVNDVLVDGASVGVNNSYQFTNVLTNHTIAVSFKRTIITHTITGTSGSNGSISPAGNVVVNDGDSKTINFTPDSGYIIKDVLVDGVSVGNASSYRFNNVVADHTISVTYEVSVTNYTITASSGVNGSISPAGATVVSSNSNQSYAITPNAGYQIASLIVDGSPVPISNPFSFNNVISNHTISVSFDLIPVTHVIISSAEAGGTITPTGNINVGDGLNKTFSITPDADMKIQDVLVDGISVGNVNRFTFNNVTINHTISAHFSAITITHNVFVIANPNGNASPKGNITVGEGKSLTVNFTANAGFRISQVIVDGKNVGAVSEYKLVNITSDHKITASFESSEILHQITATSGFNGNISPSGIQAIGDKNSQEFLFTPDKGFEIKDVIVDGISVGSPESYRFLNVVKDHSIEVHYSVITLDSNKDITSFSFQNFNPTVIGEINEDEIILFVPANTETYALVATFKTTGVQVKVKGVEQISGTSYLDFRSPVRYDVIAKDGTVKSYTVTIYKNNLDNPGLLEFEFSKYSTSETSGEISINVFRRNGNEGKATVQVKASDLSAKNNIDYAGETTTLTWEDGDDSPKEFKIKILKDNLKEENESFLIKLTNFTGSNKGSINQSEIIIRDAITIGEKEDNNDNTTDENKGTNDDTGKGDVGGGCSYSNQLSPDVEKSNIVFWFILLSFSSISILIKKRLNQ